MTDTAIHKSKPEKPQYFKKKTFEKIQPVHDYLRAGRLRTIFVKCRTGPNRICTRVSSITLGGGSVASPIAEPVSPSSMSSAAFPFTRPIKPRSGLQSQAATLMMCAIHQSFEIRSRQSRREEDSQPVMTVQRTSSEKENQATVYTIRVAKFGVASTS